MTFPAGFIFKTTTEILSPYADLAFLMGSAKTPRFNKESDIDVAVFWNLSTSLEQMKTCSSDLEDKFNRDVELVSLNSIDDIFARQVLETGRLLFNHSAGNLLDWKVKMMSNYPDFKISRKIIEDNILNRKKYV